MTEPVVLRTVRELAHFVASRGSGTVGFVPTMGMLHDGHLSLVHLAARETQTVVVSIFVNPTQFGPNEDFHKYPRSLERDLQTLRGQGASAVFAPDVAEMYPASTGTGAGTMVHVSGVSETLCGPFRPGHFDGVATVVNKLLHAVGPCRAYLGRKDFQQLAVIRRMVADLFLPVQVVGAPTVRDPDGLAMSSRNAYLSGAERDRALGIARGLRAAHQAFELGERDAETLRAAAIVHIAPIASSIEYVSVADPESLALLEGDVSDCALLAVAIRIGTTRLIDNLELGVDPSP